MSGSIESVTLGGRRFTVAADNDAERVVGGFSNENKANGDGTLRTIKTRSLSMFRNLQLNVRDERGDQEYLQSLSDQTAGFAFTVTYATGAVWQGNGQFEGELVYSNMNAVVTCSLAGSGKTRQQ